LKTIVFIDGYNLYYGAVRRTPYKWLDIYKLFSEQLLHQDAELLEVRYYTAPVLGSLCDDPASPQRQRQYLQALRKLYPEKITIIEGKLIRGDATLRLSQPIPELPEVSKVKVITLTEKKTDVNIAADMIAGAFNGHFEQAVLCSNDSDMEGALKTIRKNCPDIRLGLVAPTAAHGRFISNDLKAQAHWTKTISAEDMALAQLPQKIRGTAITKPEKW
jgi:uncharacterized LabA/DUF88 family protein